MDFKKIYVLLFIFLQVPIAFEVFGAQGPQQDQFTVPEAQRTNNFLQFAKRWLENKTGSNIGWFYQFYGLTAQHKQKIVMDYYYNQGNEFGTEQIAPEVWTEFNQLYPTVDPASKKILVDPVFGALGKAGGKLGEMGTEMLLKRLSPEDLTLEQRIKHYDNSLNESNQMLLRRKERIELAEHGSKDREKHIKKWDQDERDRERIKREGIYQQFGALKEPASQFTRWLLKISWNENDEFEKEFEKLEEKESNYYENSCKFNKKMYEAEDKKYVDARTQAMLFDENYKHILEKSQLPIELTEVKITSGAEKISKYKAEIIHNNKRIPLYKCTRSENSYKQSGKPKHEIWLTETGQEENKKVFLAAPEYLYKENYKAAFKHVEEFFDKTDDQQIVFSNGWVKLARRRCDQINKLQQKIEQKGLLSRDKYTEDVIAASSKEMINYFSETYTQDYKWKRGNLTDVRKKIESLIDDTSSERQKNLYKIELQEIDETIVFLDENYFKMQLNIHQKGLNSADRELEDALDNGIRKQVGRWYDNSWFAKDIAFGISRGVAAGVSAVAAALVYAVLNRGIGGGLNNGGGNNAPPVNNGGVN